MQEICNYIDCISLICKKYAVKICRNMQFYLQDMHKSIYCMYCIYMYSQLCWWHNKQAIEAKSQTRKGRTWRGNKGSCKQMMDRRQQGVETQPHKQGPPGQNWAKLGARADTGSSGWRALRLVTPTRTSPSRAGRTLPQQVPLRPSEWRAEISAQGLKEPEVAGSSGQPARKARGPRPEVGKRDPWSTGNRGMEKIRDQWIFCRGTCYGNSRYSE